MKKDLVPLGYYICKYTNCPEFLNGIAEKIISVSECLCIHEPRIYLCHGWKPNGDNNEYISSCFSDKKSYIKMSGEITALLENGLFEQDGKFLHKENAVYFYKEYFHAPEYIPVCVSTKDKYTKLLDCKLPAERNTAEEINGSCIGYDIIGWDICCFHSFLCNDLEKRFSGLRFNSYGLLNEPYCTAEKMALSIQGMGESVNWIPVVLHKIEIN